MNRENIHDRIFKHNFKKIEVAPAFHHHNLPKKTRAAINLELLELLDAEFIPSAYRRARRADILYTTQSHTGRDVCAWLLESAAQKDHKEGRQEGIQEVINSLCKQDSLPKSGFTARLIYFSPSHIFWRVEYLTGWRRTSWL